VNERRIGNVPDRTSADLDTLLARIAARTSGLRDGGNASTGGDERGLLADLAAAAAELRASITAIGGSLTRVMDSPGTAARERPARRHRSGTAPGRGLDPLTRHAILRGTDKWGPHFYTPVYHELFQHLRELPIRVLEIGVGGHESALVGGASLLMWADYFPHARIVGIDVAEKRVAAHPRITILQGSQEDAGFLAQVLADHGPFDIVIDDGSHVPAHVHASFDVLFPALRDDGLYVIEDVQTAFWPRFGGSPDGAETMNLARTALAAINHAEISVVDPEWTPPPIAPIIRSLRAYHNLLVFQKGDNREPSMRRVDPSSPHMNDALAVMEQILDGTPTAEGFAHLARSYSQARLGARAIDTARRGLALWPDSVHLLMVGAKAARRWGDDALRARCIERLGAVAGDDPFVRELIRKSSEDK
jgi:hypothetical protein